VRTERAVDQVGKRRTTGVASRPEDVAGSTEGIETGPTVKLETGGAERESRVATGAAELSNAAGAERLTYRDRGSIQT
jgi:hypothetical protein